MEMSTQCVNFLDMLMKSWNIIFIFAVDAFNKNLILLSFPVFQGPLVLPRYHAVSLVAAPRAI